MGFGEAARAWMLPAAGPALSAAAAAAPASCWGPPSDGCPEHAAPCGAMAVDQEQQAACVAGAWSLANPLPIGTSGPLKLKKCGSWSPLVAMGQPADAGCWPAEPARAELQWRHRSLTPDEAVLASSEEGPITPTAAPSLAAVSPAATAALEVPGADCAGGAVPQHARRATAAAMWRRMHSFMRVVATSPLVQSALLSLELGGTHPARAEPGTPSAAGLDWTLAQLLAMHLKAGFPEASEHTVLASLWLLESVESVWRSPATVCLNDYLKHLAVFSPEAVVAITADWKASFQQLRAGVVGAQMDLLKRLDWRTRLDAAAEVQPCRALLFRTASPCAAARPSLRDRWAAHMHLLVQQVQQKAHMLNKHGRLASEVEAECAAVEGHLTPTKRQRIHA